MIKFKEDMITDEMKAAAKTVFTCMALVETIKPVVEGYERKILKSMQALPDKEWREKEGVILEPQRAYLLDDNDFKFYLAECNKERIKADLRVDNPEFCPLLVAENYLRQAEHLLVDVMKPITGLEIDDLFGNGLENYDKYIKLTLRLLAKYVRVIK